MLIGISGYIGSGKDTVATMIQYLATKGLVDKGRATNGNPPMPYPSYEEWISKQYHGGAYGNWEIRKFAGKLKQMVSLLTGYTLAELEKEEVKNTELGEDWWFWRETSSWSNSVKIYPWSTYKTEPSFPHCQFVKPTVRWLLQTMGTDAMRDVIHPNIHVNGLFADYKALPAVEFCDGAYIGTCMNCKQQFTGDKRQGWCKECVDNQVLRYPNWIISDMRFPNEMQAVQSRRGITVRVNRPTFIVGTCSAKINRHSSETSLDDAVFDFIIENNAGIPELLEQVKEMLTLYKIL